MHVPQLTGLPESTLIMEHAFTVSRCLNANTFSLCPLVVESCVQPHHVIQPLLLKVLVPDNLAQSLLRLGNLHGENVGLLVKQEVEAVAEGQTENQVLHGAEKKKFSYLNVANTVVAG